MQGNPENQNFLAPQREEKDNNNHFNLCPCFLGNRHLSNTSPSRERFSIAYQTGALCNCSLNVPQQSPHHVPLFRFILSYIFHPLSAFFILSFSPSCSHLYPFSEGFFFAHDSGLCVTESFQLNSFGGVGCSSLAFLCIGR